MTQQLQQSQLYEELTKVIDRFVSEYELTTPSVVGVLEIIKMEILLDNVGNPNQRD